jgi:hypothetical protein
MSVAAKVEVCFFLLLALLMAGCDGAMKHRMSAEPLWFRNLACKKVAGSDALADCVCNSPAFAFNAKTGKEEVQCAGETK